MDIGQAYKLGLRHCLATLSESLEMSNLGQANHFRDMNASNDSIIHFWLPPEVEWISLPRIAFYSKLRDGMRVSPVISMLIHARLNAICALSYVMH